MDHLSSYHNTTVRIYTDFGEILTGPCEWCSPEEGLDFFGREEESLRIGDDFVFADEIRQLVLLRGEACIPVRDWPEALEEIAAWFHDRWGIPLETYRESIRDCLGNETAVPQWYVVVRGHRIIAGCGVIENDFHRRPDLTPNVCAVYVDPEYRNRGVAGFLLDFVCADLARLGYETLYLLTDHTGFYERYGWQFLCTVPCSDGSLSRMYVHRAGADCGRPITQGGGLP